MQESKELESSANEELDLEIKNLADANDPSKPVGTILAEARKAIDLSVEEVASQLNLSAATISALEAGNADDLPEMTYVRGYIRSYARLLKLDAETLLANFSREYQGEVNVSYDDLPHGLSDDEFLVSRKRQPLWRWAALLLLVIGVMLWWFKPAEILAWITDSPPVLSSSPQERQAQRVVEQQESIEGNTSEASPAMDESSDVAPEVSSDAEIAPNLSESADTVEASAPIENVLLMRFESTCWVDVRDSEGTRLVFKSVVGGEDLEVSSALAMNVLLGNAEGVTATLNGEEFDIQQYRQGVYAKFSIPAPAQ